MTIQNFTAFQTKKDNAKLISNIQLAEMKKGDKKESFTCIIQKVILTQSTRTQYTV